LLPVRGEVLRSLTGNGETGPGTRGPPVGVPFPRRFSILCTSRAAVPSPVESDRAWQTFVAYDPLPIGGVAVALMLGTTALLEVPVDGPLLGAAFCGTALVYLADRALGLSPEDRYNQPQRVAWVRTHTPWLLAEAVGLGIGLLLIIPLLQFEAVLVAAGLGSVGGIHVLSGPGLGRETSGALGSVTVSFVWAVGAVVLPVLEAGAPVFSVGAAALTVYRVPFILANVLLVDWADRKGDAAVGTGSWATGWSRRDVQKGTTGVLAFAVGGAVGGVWIGSGSALLLIDALGSLLLLGGVWMLRPERSALHRLALDLAIGWPIVPWLVSVVSSG